MAVEEIIPSVKVLLLVSLFSVEGFIEKRTAILAIKRRSDLNFYVHPTSWDFSLFIAVGVFIIPYIHGIPCHTTFLWEPEINSVLKASCLAFAAMHRYTDIEMCNVWPQMIIGQRIKIEVKGLRFCTLTFAARKDIQLLTCSWHSIFNGDMNKLYLLIQLFLGSQSDNFCDLRFCFCCI